MKICYRGSERRQALAQNDAVIGTTPAQVASGVEYAKSQAALLTLLNNTVPLIAVILGAILLVIGIILVAAGGKKRSGAHAGGFTAA